MKKRFFILILTLLTLTGCSSKEVTKSVHSDVVTTLTEKVNEVSTDVIFVEEPIEVTSVDSVETLPEPVAIEIPFDTDSIEFQLKDRVIKVPKLDAVDCAITVDLSADTVIDGKPAEYYHSMCLRSSNDFDYFNENSWYTFSGYEEAVELLDLSTYCTWVCDKYMGASLNSENVEWTAPMVTLPISQIYESPKFCTITSFDQDVDDDVVWYNGTIDRSSFPLLDTSEGLIQCTLSFRKQSETLKGVRVVLDELKLNGLDLTNVKYSIVYNFEEQPSGSPLGAEEAFGIYE